VRVVSIRHNSLFAAICLLAESNALVRGDRSVY